MDLIFRGTINSCRVWNIHHKICKQWLQTASASIGNKIDDIERP